MAREELFEWHAIKPNKGAFSSARVRAMVLNELKFQGKMIRDTMRLTTEHWEHKPDFAYVIRYKGGDPLLQIGLSGTSKYNLIWKHVNDGTTRRRVIFHRDYVPKTSYPGNIGNNTAGAYTKTIKEAGKFRGMNFSKDSKIQGYSDTYLNGIRPRHWVTDPDNPSEEGVINQMHEELFSEAIQDAIRRGMIPK
jgi:hypothetical protein